MLAVFQSLVKFGRRLEKQEDTADQHDQIAPGEREIAYAYQRLGQRDHPRDNRKQPQTHNQRQRQADDTCLITLFWRQFIGKDGDKDQVIDTQNNFEDYQRQQASPDGGIH